MNQETARVLEKLKHYNGSLISTSWKVPKSKRQFSFALNRVVKLYHAMHNRNLFYPELVEKVKEIAYFFKMYVTLHRPDKTDYLFILEEIVDFEPPVTFVRIEEARIREIARCSVCSVPLVHPGFLIYITQDGQEVRSRPTGIHCLHSLHGKLEKFTDSLKLEWEIDHIVNEVETTGGEALQAVI